MDAVINLSWSVYPAFSLMAVGSVLVLEGTRSDLVGLRHVLKGDSSKLVPWIQGFRLSVIGLALVGLGVAWQWHLMWLFVLSLAIGGEETLESSVVIFALKRGQQLEEARSLSSGPHHQDSGEAKIRESTAEVSRKPSSDGKARGSSSKHLCGLTAWNT